jgi:hypothetical protein
MEQPEAVSRCLGYGGRFSKTGVHLGGLDLNAAKLTPIRNLVIAACGTAWGHTGAGGALTRLYAGWRRHLPLRLHVRRFSHAQPPRLRHRPGTHPPLRRGRR